MHVVLVEPSRAAADFVARMLSARNHQVRTFADGHEALACIKSDPDIDAVITAPEPHSMSGLELCWETRLVAGSQRPIYVILMSTSPSEDRLALALGHGADDILNNPPAADELYERLRAAERFGHMQRELIRLAVTDSLTGMFNRRGFFEQALQPCRRAEEGTPLCAIMADIDDFKRINDEHGHDAGDKAIFAVAHELMSGSWHAGRLGGEEFALLVEGRNLAEAATIAERLRERIAALRIPTGEDRLSLTCSFGVSEWRAGDSIDPLLKRADMALYEAKLTGRDRVVEAGDEFASPGYSGAGRPVRAVRRGG
jgi:two-component system, cell cycle response regulator